MPVAFAADDRPGATKSASITKQIKNLKRQVAALSTRLAAVEAKPDQVGQVPASLPPAGPAGGALTGTYPNPLIAPDAIGAGQIVNGSLGTTEFASSIPAVHVTHDALQPIVDTETTVAFNTERYDTANMHDNATNNSRLTAPVSGVYLVTAQVHWSNISPTGDRSLFVRKNGTTAIGIDNRVPDVAGTPQAIATQVKLAAGDYVEVRVDESGTGADNISTDGTEEFSPEFAMTWLAPG